ncbi:MAG: DUF1565 domain-containing protein [Leptolyngbyaceae cyanobacterium bins.302]|nr:DUF1565 domain-containing protein [Leptolyngbyaceae cyanobacterium bins.302]
MKRTIAWMMGGLLLGVSGCATTSDTPAKTQCTAAIARVRESWQVTYVREGTDPNPFNARIEEFNSTELTTQNRVKPANGGVSSDENGVWFPETPPQPTTQALEQARQVGEKIQSPPQLQRQVLYFLECEAGQLLADEELYKDAALAGQQAQSFQVLYSQGRVLQLFLPSGGMRVGQGHSEKTYDPRNPPKPTPSDRVDNTPDIYVDSQNGSDRNPGNDFQPFKTITHAMQQAKFGTVIYVLPGIYNAATGEKFPLQMKPGVFLRGEPNTPPQEIQITGGGKFLSPTWAGQSVTIVANKDSQIAGLSITNPNTRGTAVWVETGSPTIEQNRFVGSDREGVFVSGNAKPKIWYNTFEQNGGNGLVFTRDSGGVVQGNVIRNQGFGIAIGDRATPNIFANQIRQNKDGIVINGDSRPTLESNKIEGNGRDGIVVTNNARPILVANTFATNSDYDLHNATKNTLQLQRTNLASLKIQGAVN